MSLFGNTNATTTTSTPSFSFGNTNNNTASNSSLFGNTNANSKPSLFSGFGTSSSSSTSTPPNAGGTGGGLFGQSSAAGGGGGGGSLFGSSLNTNSNSNAQGSGAPAPSFSLFGSSNNQQQQQQTSLFGQSQPQQQQNPGSSLFASANKPNPLTFSSLGASTSSAIAGPSNLGGTTGAAAPSIEDRIMSIKNSWDPSSPSNRFAYFFYNLSPQPLTVSLTQLPVPPNIAASQHLSQLYKQSVLENPRPDVYLPTLASSMDDLQKRVNAQKQMANLHLGKLQGNEMQGKIREANKKHWSDTVVRIDRLNREQIKLEERLVRLCARLAGIQPSSSASKDDVELLVVLQRIQSELAGGPSAVGGSRNSSRHSQANQGSARLAGVVNELWMIVSQRKAMMQGRTATPDANGSSGTSQAEWGIADEGEMQKVLEVLAAQQKSLDYLSKTLRTLLVDIDTCRLGFGLPPIANRSENQQEGGKDRPAIMA